ncbi:MAG: MFS transporter [candidate division KSB1 bacterium]|nr:MFS transporter [candidate division KSB1 bacterium]MDZ7275676.1 MFS transporter [candidate division KSB1 bacterium]MDZ7284633.1 MFS transporter [candidate division KSB1 bacterium]MDZ7297948.1 MFS transporter [candidate division KSB1 bacterium]MDZ7308323.1 MFS transporter [candidate division KSB1 bacterium]
MKTQQSAPVLAVMAAALGYFVDLYDIVLFGVVRVASLTDLGLSGDALTSKGILLLNLQMIGMLLGGVGWGIIGDKFGRRLALLATIAMYSLANIANAFVQGLADYALLRLLAGIGLAGEFGAGITLVSEILPARYRGYGTTVVSFLGLVGALTASFVGSAFHWRTAYLVGGLMGLVVLLGRFLSLRESEMFAAQKSSGREMGNALLLLRSRRALLKYLGVVAVGVPIWYVSGILVTFSQEFSQALALHRLVPAAETLRWQAVGLAIGSALTGVISEMIKSRKRVVWGCFLLMAALIVTVLSLRRVSALAFLVPIFIIGLGQGYWTVFITMAAEQFGTNIRATVTTSVPNFVRAMVVPMTTVLDATRHQLGLIPSTLAIGGVVFLLAFWALYNMSETHGRNLDFVEEG